MGYYIHVVTVFVIGNTILKEVVTVMIGNYIHRVNVIKGSLFSPVRYVYRAMLIKCEPTQSNSRLLHVSK